MIRVCLALTALLLSTGVGQASSVTLISLNGGDTGTINVGAFNGGSAFSANVYIDQFNVSYTNAGQTTSFATFCVDLFHDVSLNQTYQVYTDSYSGLSQNFNNAQRMAQVYNLVQGWAAINPNGVYTVPGTTGPQFSGNDYAAGIQLALWELSINTTNHNPTGFTNDGNGVWSSGDPSVFNATGITTAAGSVANALLSTPLSDTVSNVGFLDATAQGTYQNRGQSLLLVNDTLLPPTPSPDAPEPSTLGLTSLAFICGFFWVGWKRRSQGIQCRI